MTSEYKISLPPQTIDTAQGSALALLEKARAQVGFVPNMYAGMVNAPALLETYLDGYARFRSDGGFTPAEQEVVFLIISRFHGCDYCVAAHSMIAEKKSQVPADILAAIRQSRPIPDPRLAALAEFTERMVESRGLPRQGEVENFLSTGYAERHILSIVLAIAVKVMSNYANHLLHTPVDSVFASHRMEAAE